MPAPRSPRVGASRQARVQEGSRSGSLARGRARRSGRRPGERPGGGLARRAGGLGEATWAVWSSGREERNPVGEGGGKTKGEGRPGESPALRAIRAAAEGRANWEAPGCVAQRSRPLLPRGLEEQCRREAERLAGRRGSRRAGGRRAPEGDEGGFGRSWRQRSRRAPRGREAHRRLSCRGRPRRLAAG